MIYLANVSEDDYLKQRESKRLGMQSIGNSVWIILPVLIYWRGSKVESGPKVGG
jgi:ribosomal protein L27